MSQGEAKGASKREGGGERHMILPLTKMDVGTDDRVIEKGARTTKLAFRPHRSTF